MQKYSSHVLGYWTPLEDPRAQLVEGWEVNFFLGEAELPRDDGHAIDDACIIS